MGALITRAAENALPVLVIVLCAGCLLWLLYRPRRKTQDRKFHNRGEAPDEITALLRYSLMGCVDATPVGMEGNTYDELRGL